jgi:hypothetical protein
MLSKFAGAAVLALGAALAACDTRADGPAGSPANEERAADASGAAAADESGAADDNAGTAEAGKSDKGPIARLFSREPDFREVTVPAGTVLPVELQTTIASDESRVEDPVRARVRQAVVIDGVTVIPAGSPITGVVTTAKRSGRVKGRAEIGFRLSTLQAHEERHAIRTGIVARRAPATKTQDAVDIGIPAAAGAVAGAIVGGKDDAAKGAIIGGAAGTGYVLATRGKEVRVPAGTDLAVKLLEPISIRVPLGK